MELWYWIIEYIAEMTKLYLFLFCISKIEKNTKRKVVFIVIFDIIVIIILFIKGVNEDLLLGTLLVTVISGNILLLKKISWFYYALLGEVLISVIDVLFAGIIFDIAGYSMIRAEYDAIIDIAINAMSLLLLLGISIIIYIRGGKRSINPQIRGMSKSILLILIGLLAMSFYIVPIQKLILGKQKTSAQTESLLGLTISGVIFIVIIIICLTSIYSKEQLKIKNDLYGVLVKQQKMYYEDLLKREVETKKFRHDVIGHLSIIKLYLERGMKNKANLYIEQLLGKTQAFKGETSSGNVIIDTIIKLIRSEENDVEIIWNGIFPSNTKMIETDICSLFFNLINNAIQATEKSKKDKKIVIDIKILEKNLFLHIMNPIEEGKVIKFKKGRPMTEKSQVDHGFGMLNIEEIVKKYHGNIEYEVNEKFVTNIILSNIIS